MSERKERPILMSAPMVRALLDGRKTQTRRLVKVPKHIVSENLVVTSWDRFDASLREQGVKDDARPYLTGERWEGERLLGNLRGDLGRGMIACPYGVPGDRLWVRETWFSEWDEQCKEFDPPRYRYRATETEHCIKVDGDGFTVFNRDGSEASPWRSPRFMPRTASRIALELTSVRVQRLNSISTEDATAEGVKPSDAAAVFRDGVRVPEMESTPIGAFACLWDSLNAKRAPWASNPWVWVIEFRRIANA